MLKNKTALGASTGALIALLWILVDGTAVFVVVGFAAVGALIGLVLDRPDALIGLLQRLQDR